MRFLGIVAVEVTLATYTTDSYTLSIALFSGQYRLISRDGEPRTLTFFCLHRSQAFLLRPFSFFWASGGVDFLLRGEAGVYDLWLCILPMVDVAQDVDQRQGKRAVKGWTFLKNAGAVI